MSVAPIVPLRPDLRRLRDEIEGLRARAEAGGYGTMAYQLLCARIEADRQIRQAEEDAADVPEAERWRPVGPAWNPRER